MLLLLRKIVSNLLQWKYSKKAEKILKLNEAHPQLFIREKYFVLRSKYFDFWMDFCDVSINF